MSGGGSLSQEEIDALLKAGADAGPTAEEPAPAAGHAGPELDEAERDTIGEVGNICMSSAATTLSLLLSRPVPQASQVLVTVENAGGADAPTTKPFLTARS